MPTPVPNTDLLDIDDQLTDEERLLRDTVRAFTTERVLPHVADWFEAGTLPREIMPELGKLGLLGMHLTGYGWPRVLPGPSPTASPAGSWRHATPACAARRPSRARWQCSRSGGSGRRSKRLNGFPGWQPETRSAASGSPRAHRRLRPGRHADLRPAGRVRLGALRDQDVDQGVTGAARTCLESAVEYARTRVQFGRPIGSFQLTQAKLSWMAVDLYRSQLLALHVGLPRRRVRSRRCRSASPR